MKKIIFLLAFFLCISKGESFAQQPKPFLNADKNYSIEFPSNWVFDYDKNSIVSALAACDSLDTRNMLMLTTGTSGALSLNEAFKVTKMNLKLGKKNPIESEGEIVINNSNARWCVFNMSTQAGLRKIKMYILKKGARQYTIQAKLLPEEYESKIELFDKVISTFQITAN